MQCYIVPGLLENSHTHLTPGPDQGSPTQKPPLDELIAHLQKTYTTMEAFGLDQQVICQVFKHLFFYLCAAALNNLLLRRELCHWSKGLDIRFNVSQLEEWARTKKMESINDVLKPLIEASQILQAKKTDVDVICSIPEKLTIQQVRENFCPNQNGE